MLTTLTLSPNMMIKDNLDRVVIIKAVDFLQDKVLVEGLGLTWLNVEACSGIKLTSQILTTHLGFNKTQANRLFYENKSRLVLEVDKLASLSLVSLELASHREISLKARLLTKASALSLATYLCTVSFVHELQRVNDIVTTNLLTWRP